MLERACHESGVRPPWRLVCVTCARSSRCPM